MKQKNLMRFVFLSLGCILFFSCAYNDTPLWEEIDKIKTEVKSLKGQIGSVQTLVDAHEKGHFITDLKKNKDNTGYLLTLNDGRTIEILNGENAPEISIDELDGRYYWVYKKSDGTSDYILDKNGNKVPVTGNNGEDGKDGKSPVISIDKDGYWTVNGAKIKDENNQPISAKGETGDSFFKEIKQDNSNNTVTFVLADGKSITIPMQTQTSRKLVITQPEDGTNYYLLQFGKRLEIPATISMIKPKDLHIEAPIGWSVSLNYKDNLDVKAPKQRNGQYSSGGEIKLSYIDENGLQYVAKTEVYAVDFSDPDATFVLSEGNMSDSNGTLNYYDREGRELRMIYKKVNEKFVGNVLQDMYIYGDRIYLLTQNGDQLNGENRFVVCDLKTMKKIYSDPLKILTNKEDGKPQTLCWPQHLVVTSDQKAFVQWSSSDMESRSGIVELSLSDKSVKVGKHLMDTYGDFTKSGATKTRMVYSKGLIFAGLGERIGIIDPTTSKVKKIVSTGNRQVKGIAKGANGNIFAVCAGNYEGSQQWNTKYTTNAKVIEINHNGEIIDDDELPESMHLPVATWSPAVGLCASFNESYLYFVDVADFNANSVARFNYDTDKIEPSFMISAEGHVVYGIMGVHPRSNNLWVGTSYNYVESTILVCDTHSNFADPIYSYHYPTRNGASPAGVDFHYRFTKEWINK